MRSKDKWHEKTNGVSRTAGHRGGTLTARSGLRSKRDNGSWQVRHVRTVKKMIEEEKPPSGAVAGQTADLAAGNIRYSSPASGTQQRERPLQGRGRCGRQGSVLHHRRKGRRSRAVPTIPRTARRGSREANGIHSSRETCSLFRLEQLTGSAELTARSRISRCGSRVRRSQYIVTKSVYQNNLCRSLRRFVSRVLNSGTATGPRRRGMHLALSTGAKSKISLSRN